MISIITITKDNPQDLITTLRSIDYQKFSDVEVIIVDANQEPAESVTLARKYVFPPKKVVVLPGPDLGIANAFNKGLQHASGTIVNFLNAGDSFASEDVLSLVAESHSEGEWAWAFGWRNRVGKEGESRPPRSKEMESVTKRRFFTGQAFISHQATFVSRRALDAVPAYNEHYMTYAMDIEFLCRLWDFEDPAQIKAILVNYDVTGISFRNFEKSLAIKTQVLLGMADWPTTHVVRFVYYRTLVFGLVTRFLNSIRSRVCS